MNSSIALAVFLVLSSLSGSFALAGPSCSRFIVRPGCDQNNEKSKMGELPVDLLYKILSFSEANPLRTMEAINQDCREYAYKCPPNPAKEIFLKGKISRIEDILSSQSYDQFQQQDLQFLLEHRNLFIETLLASINAHDISTLRVLISQPELDSNKAYLAAFLARYTVNLSAARNAARDAARNAAWDAARNATQQSLRVLGLSNPTEIGQIAYQLSELFTLNWVKQNNAQYFKDAFKAAYAFLDGSVTIDQAKSIIENHLNQPNLSTNPFIVELKAFLKQSEEILIESNAS